MFGPAYVSQDNAHTHTHTYKHKCTHYILVKQLNSVDFRIALTGSHSELCLTFRSVASWAGNNSQQLKFTFERNSTMRKTNEDDANRNKDRVRVFLQLYPQGCSIYIYTQSYITIFHIKSPSKLNSQGIYQNRLIQNWAIKFYTVHGNVKFKFQFGKKNLVLYQRIAKNYF